jgi:hypothetical protein
MKALKIDKWDVIGGCAFVATVAVFDLVIIPRVEMLIAVLNRVFGGM